MKKLALVLSMLFLFAGIASATDLTLTGWFEAQGKYEDNLGATLTDDDALMYYDTELTMNFDWAIADTTSVHLQLETFDMTWGATRVLGSDDNVFAEDVWGKHTFASGLEMQIGFFGANSWGTDFADEGGDRWRTKFQMPTGFGTVIGVIEKELEGGTLAAGEADFDQYILALVTKAGALTVMPLIQYSDLDNANATAWDFALAISGSTGALGYEGEVVYAALDAATDAEVWGAYGNVWAQMDALKIGGWVAYGSFDEDSGTAFSFGDNFGPGGSMIWGDGGYLVTDGQALNTDQNFGGGMAFGIYGAYTASEALSFTSAFFYFAGDSGAAATMNDDSAYEINVQGKYKVTDALTYSFGAAYAAMDLDGSADPDDAVEAYHKFSFAF